MYCVRCGVELCDSEEKCPLCGTPVFHPDIRRPDGEKPYPPDAGVPAAASRSGVLFILTMLFLLPLITVLLCDWQINHTIVWSGYVGGALAVAYVVVILPFWFRRVPPAVFVAADFVAAGLYLLYINCAVGGHWFLPFAFPVTGGLGAIAVTAAVLLRHTHRGRLFIAAGIILALGGFTVLIEFLLNLTFGLSGRLVWSVFPLAGCMLVGITLLVIACCPPLRESLRRKLLF